MVLNKSILVTLFLSYFLFTSSIDATRLSLSPSYSPAPSPTSQNPLQQPLPTISLPKPPPAKLIDPKLKALCANTENPQHCVSYIAPFVKGTVKADTTLKVVIKTLKTYVTEASEIAMQMRSESSTSMEIKGSIDASVELYEKAIVDLDKASVACTSLNLEETKVMLGAAISDLGYCNEAFEKQGVTSWKLKETNEMLIEFAGFGVDISSKMSKSVKVQKTRKVSKSLETN